MRFYVKIKIPKFTHETFWNPLTTFKRISSIIVLEFDNIDFWLVFNLSESQIHNSCHVRQDSKNKIILRIKEKSSNLAGGLFFI